MIWWMLVIYAFDCFGPLLYTSWPDIWVTPVCDFELNFLYLSEKSDGYFSWQRHFNICGTALEWFPSWSLQMPYKSKIVILRAKSLVSGRIKTTNNKNKNLPICLYPTYQKLLLSWRGNPAHLLGEPNLAIYIQFLTNFVLVCLSLLLIVLSHCSPSATR